MPTWFDAINNFTDQLILVDTFFGAALFITLFPDPTNEAKYAVVSLCFFILSLFIAFWSKVCIHWHPTSHVDIDRVDDYKVLMARELKVKKLGRVIKGLLFVFNPAVVLFIATLCMWTGMILFLFPVVCKHLAGYDEDVCWGFSGLAVLPVLACILGAYKVWNSDLWREFLELREFLRQWDKRMEDYELVSVDTFLEQLAQRPAHLEETETERKAREDAETTWRLVEESRRNYADHDLREARRERHRRSQEGRKENILFPSWHGRPTSNRPSPRAQQSSSGLQQTVDVNESPLPSKMEVADSVVEV